jgi:hypothetical protein
MNLKLFRFDLAPCAVRRARPAHRHIGIAAEAAFLHVAVADVEPHHERVQCLRVFHRFSAATHVGFGDDFQQRRAGAVEVDAGLALIVLVQRLAGVFFEVRACQVHLVRLVADEELDRAALHHRRFVLADLVALGQVWVEIVLAREDRQRRDGRPHRQAEADRTLDRAAVHHRQRAGKRQIDRRGLRIRRGTEGGGRAAEYLRLRRELRVGLQADDDFETADEFCRGHVQYPAGERVCQSVACWNACAACSSVPSWK